MVTSPFTFVVRHRAAPQGSKDLRTNSRGGKYMAEASKGVKPFRTALRRAALGADGLPMAKFEGPVMVTIAFEFVRPKSNDDPYPTTKSTVGDVDKLTRAALDGLTEAGVIEDDRYVVALESVTKMWGPEDLAVITVRSAPTPESLAQSIVDFADAQGIAIDPWQRAVMERIYAVQARTPLPDDPIAAMGIAVPGSVSRSDLGLPEPPYAVPKVRNPFETDSGPCVGCGEGDEGNHTDGWCVR